MTCIVGIEHEGKVYLGGDSIAMVPDTLFACSITDPKIFIVENIGIGFAGSFRGGQVIKYAFKPPPMKDNASGLDYLVTDFADALRDTLHEKGILKKENDIEEVDTDALIALNGSLYWMAEDMQFGRSDDGYHAVGCGQHFAMGALGAIQTYAPELSPEEKLLSALRTAAQHCSGVRGPFHVICVENSVISSSKKRKPVRDKEE